LLAVLIKLIKYYP